MEQYDLRYEEMFQRNFGVVTFEDQEKIKNTSVSIIGLGDLGLAAIIAAKAGFGKIVAVDRGTFDYTDFSQQILATSDHIGSLKVKAAEETIARHNPLTDLSCISADIQTVENAKDCLKDTQYCIIGLQDPLSRIIVARAAQELGITYTVCATIGWRLLMTSFIPGGVTYEEFTLQPSLGKEMSKDLLPALDSYQRCFFACSSGFSHEYMETQLRTKDDFNSIIFASSFIATMAVSEIMKMVISRGLAFVAPKVFTLDMITGEPWDLLETSLKSAQMLQQLNTNGMEAAVATWQNIIANQ